MYGRGPRLCALLLSGFTKLSGILSRGSKYDYLGPRSKGKQRGMSLRKGQVGLGAQAAYVWEGA